MLNGILGRKVGMTQLFSPNGTALPATVIEAGPCTITQVKSAPTDGYDAVQIGFDIIEARKATRAKLGHLGHSLPQTPSQRRKAQQTQARERQRQRDAAKAKRTTESDELASEAEADEAESRGEAAVRADGKRARRRRGTGAALGPFRTLREVRRLDEEPVKIGDKIDVAMFRVGEEVDVIGTSKGKGFAGVMKRHGFSGGQRTHGQSDRSRAPGSIGAGTTPGRVLKGTRMAGRMGNERVTIKKLEVLQADAARNLLVIRGSVPGPNGGLVMIRKIAGQTQLLSHVNVGQALEKQS